jgi:hypothetical protein
MGQPMPSPRPSWTQWSPPIPNLFRLSFFSLPRAAQWADQAPAMNAPAQRPIHGGTSILLCPFVQCRSILAWGGVIHHWLLPSVPDLILIIWTFALMSSCITAEETVCQAPSPCTARRATAGVFLALRWERNSEEKKIWRRIRNGLGMGCRRARVERARPIRDQGEN